MHLTLIFKNKNISDIETKNHDSFEKALEELKEKYIDFCFSSEEEKEVDRIELIDSENVAEIDFSKLEFDWSDSVRSALRNCNYDRIEQSALKSDYRAGLI